MLEICNATKDELCYACGKNYEYNIVPVKNDSNIGPINCMCREFTHGNCSTGYEIN